MFGLTFEKLLVVGLIAAVVIGPHRLPGVVARLVSLLRGLRRAVDTAREGAAVELGVPADAVQWRALDPRQYDPRRIIAEALAAPSVAASAPAATVPPATDPIAPDPIAPDDPIVATAAGAAHTDASPDPAPARTPTRRIRGGTSAHPRWIEVPVEIPADADPVPRPAADPAAHRVEDSSTVRVPVTA